MERRRGANGARGSARFGVAALAAATSLAIASPALAASSLQLFPDLWMTVGLIVFFLLLIIPVNQLLFRPLFRVLDEREERIAGARRRAEQLEAQARDVIGRYTTSVREVREDSELARRQQLEATRGEQQQIAAEARAQAERELESSRRDLAAQVETARAQLRASAESLADEMATRVLGGRA